VFLPVIAPNLGDAIVWWIGGLVDWRRDGRVSELQKMRSIPSQVAVELTLFGRVTARNYMQL